MAEDLSRRPSRPQIRGARWVLRHPRYLRYMARELSCLFIGGYTLLLVIGLGRLGAGREAWEGFLALLRSPASLVFHVLALAFALYHSVTWFRLTPKALPLQIGTEFVPGAVITGAHYLAWALISLVVLFLAGAF